MIFALHSRLQALLLVPLFVYLLLPLFGAVWHDVVPEHDHLLTGAVSGPDMLALSGHNHDGSAACEVCSGASVLPFETVVHAFDPVSALQVFGLIVGFGALMMLIAPLGPSMRVFPPVLFLHSPLLVPLELPPAA